MLGQQARKIDEMRKKMKVVCARNFTTAAMAKMGEGWQTVVSRFVSGGMGVIRSWRW